MNCENCGGSLRPVGNRNYFRCPYCETFHFPEETGDGVAVVGGDTPHACPVCAKALTAAAVTGHPVGYCGTCRGFLATNAVFGRAVQHKRANPAGEPPVPVPFDPAELTRRVTCPGCRKPMDTHPYHAGGNAVIDTCPRCRLVWLDAGELSVIGSFRRKSGSAEARPTSAAEAAPPIRPSTPNATTSAAAAAAGDSWTALDGVINLCGFVIRLL